MFSVSIDPVNNSLAVSGGEDDKAYVWQIQDGHTLLECLGKLFDVLFLSGIVADIPQNNIKGVKKTFCSEMLVISLHLPNSFQSSNSIAAMKPFHDSNC